MDKDCESNDLKRCLLAYHFLARLPMRSRAQGAPHWGLFTASATSLVSPRGGPCCGQLYANTSSVCLFVSGSCVSLACAGSSRMRSKSCRENWAERAASDIVVSLKRYVAAGGERFVGLCACLQQLGSCGVKATLARKVWARAMPLSLLQRR